MKTKFNQPKKIADEKKFILILSCSGGAGHIRAGEALHQTAKNSNSSVYTEHYDVLDFTSKFFKKLYSESYLQMINRAPELWGYLYQFSERKPYKKNDLLKIFDQLNYRNYLSILNKINPDAIICTHFLPYISISNELKKIPYYPPIYVSTTDFDVHQLWIDANVKKYFVYHEESAWQLESKQVPRDKIMITGIPIMPEFHIKNKPKTIRKKLGLNPSYYTILVLSGGFGIGRVKEIVEYINTTLKSLSKHKFNLLIVCGKNETTRRELIQLSYPNNVFSYVYGFVNNIHDLMDASNILVSKAGGLTSSEAMAKNLPMIIIDPIPGQESRNTDLIVEYGAGWKAINLANLSYKLYRILTNPSMLLKAQKATRLLAKPDAASIILKTICKELSTIK